MNRGDIAVYNGRYVLVLGRYPGTTNAVTVEESGRLVVVDENELVLDRAATLLRRARRLSLELDDYVPPEGATPENIRYAEDYYLVRIANAQRALKMLAEAREVLS